MERYKVGGSAFLRLWTLLDAEGLCFEKEGFQAALQGGVFAGAEWVFYPALWGHMQSGNGEGPLLVPLPGGEAL